MGLFDTLTIEYTLPMPSELGELTPEQIQKATYQTKDLGENLSYYQICKEGLLWREKVDGYFKEGDPNGESLTDRLGYFEETGRTVIRDYRTCTIHFYEFFQYEMNGTGLNNDYWLEYEATIVDGKVTKISITDFSKTDNSERKQRDEKWKREFKETETFINKWYIKPWYSPWRFCVHYLFRQYRKMQNHLPSSWNVERFLAPW